MEKVTEMRIENKLDSIYEELTKKLPVVINLSGDELRFVLAKAGTAGTEKGQDIGALEENLRNLKRQILEDIEPEKIQVEEKIKEYLMKFEKGIVYGIGTVRIGNTLFKSKSIDNIEVYYSKDSGYYAMVRTISGQSYIKLN